MRQIAPTGDFPDNVIPVKFSPPEGMEDEVLPALGLVHQDPSGEAVALEFLFELSEDEIRVLKHEPYLTLTIMSDHLHPFALQTSYPPDEKYLSLDTHTHLCTTSLSHEKVRWWKCDNPRHDHDKDRNRECDDCWDERQRLVNEGEEALSVKEHNSDEQQEDEGGEPPVSPVG